MGKTEMTRKQQQIYKVFTLKDIPLTPQEVWEKARKGQPGLGIATVYRAIKTFLDSGDLRRIEITGEPPRYEVTQKPHHHHFYCRQCTKIYEIEQCPPDLSQIVPEGFQMDEHSIVLYGLCATCLG